MTTSQEDRILRTLVQYAEADAERENELEDSPHHWVNSYPEVHYNYYGDRGVVDLHLEKGVTNATGQDRIYTEEVCEIKSESAIRNATGANEIVRQFKRHCRYFYQDPSRKPQVEYYDRAGVVFRLAFEATEDVYQHVCENWHMYSGLTHNATSDENTPIEGADYPSNWINLWFVDPDLDQVFNAHGGRKDRWIEAINNVKPEMAAKLGVATDE